MTHDEAYEIGYLTRTHGLKGEMILILDVDEPNEYAEMEVVYIEKKGKFTPYFIENLRQKNHKEWIVKFEDIDVITDAEPLAKAKLYLSTDDLPDLDDDGFYFHEIIGFEIIDENLGNVGKITDILEGNEQFLIQFFYQNAECFLPLVDEFVLEVNKETRIVHTNMPNGLLEIYTQK